MEKKSGYFPGLDALRYLMAGWIAVTHYIYVGPLHGKLAYPAAGGFLATLSELSTIALAVFFMMSGFLIVLVLEKSHPLQYFVSRVTRIAPGFLITMTLTAILLNLLGSSRAPDLATWAANLILVPQIAGYPFVDGVYWTLVVDVVFYLWLGVFAATGRLQSHFLIIMMGWMALSAANLVHFQSEVIERLFITSHAGAFSTGACIWYVWRHGWSMPGGIALLVSIYMTALGFSSYSFVEFEGGRTEGFSHLIHILMAVTSTLILVAFIRIPLKFPGLRFAYLLGAASYPMYLFHQEVGYETITLLSATLPVWLAIAVTIAFVVPATFAIAFWLEKPVRTVVTRKANRMLARHLRDPDVQRRAKSALTR